MIKFVYFDAAGTLIAPHPSVGSVYARAGAKHGLQVTPERLQLAFRNVWMKYTQPEAGGPMSAIADEATTYAWWRGLVLAVLDDVGFQGDREAVFEACYEAFSSTDAWRVYEDGKRALEKFAQQRMRLGVLSNWDPRLPKLLDALDLKRYFEILIVSAIEGAEKPDPRIFEIARKKAGVAYDEILYAGDHVHLDLDPARALGIHAYLIDRKGESGDPYAIRSLEDLVDIAEKLS